MKAITVRFKFLICIVYRSIINLIPSKILEKYILQIKPKEITNPNYKFELITYVKALFSLKKQLKLCNYEILSFFKKNIEAFAIEKYIEENYINLRMWSIKSGFELTNIIRNEYRKYFVSKDYIEDQQNKIRDNIELYGFHVIESNPTTNLYALNTLDLLNKTIVTRERDNKKGYFHEFQVKTIPGGFRYIFQEEEIPVADSLAILEKTGVLHGIEQCIGEPILRCVHAWISTNPSQYNDVDINLSAQAFHNDLDIPSGWIKVFIYLTDVDKENGPHVYVPNSHRFLKKKFRSDRRFLDNEIEDNYQSGLLIKGKAGTIIIADTIGFHKGLTVQNGYRAILQLEFSTSLIGAETPSSKLFAEKVLKETQGYSDRLLHRYIKDLK